ncbi:XRE family transcriptional regulator [Methylobacterium sp. E-005]|uniref:helix-turn-helix domain-containing protein n=1 Tax=Methylobacterium sp. E-005 TaxID=2836549 RepID=UPI001FBA2B66|nr:helix-turn-helix domain-containing protein [Methylobacterium sp. E-005]MCJ2089168.1 XRE family transcriptional regulator [Methylobacterium sp. E-005]
MAGSDEGAQSGAGAPAMSPAQSRAARGLLGWSEADLAAKVGLDERLVRDFEAGYGDPPSGQIEALRSALSAAGAVFTESPTQGVHLAEASGADEGTRLGALTTENDR